VIAILSDIHGNLEALEAVLSELRKRPVEKILCLGDIVGYGANPKECIDIVRGFDFTILGNHDEAALFVQECAFFNEKARMAIDWSRAVLEDPRDGQANQDRWNFLGELPRSYTVNGALLVHGSPRKPVKEYIFPETIFTPMKLERIFGMIDHLCYVGHTHIPGVITEDCQYFSPQTLDNMYRFTEKKAVINFGSVGQPRDGDCRAAYGLIDDEKAIFCRAEYDYRATMQKIYAVPQLDNELADRLAEGR